MEHAMAETFKKGDFKAYTAVTKVHLGSIETDLLQGETIHFDGITMKRGNDEYDISVLVAAIKVGWLVPEGETGSYSPLPADIKVHSATNRQDKRGVQLQVDIQDEERDMGTIAEVRAEGSPPVHIASSAGKLSRGAPTGAAQYNDDEGKVVGRMRSAAKSEPIKLDGSDRKVVSELDNSGRKIVDPVVEKKAIATGDVEEARSGSELEDLLPNAAAVQAPDLNSRTTGEGRGDESDRRARAVTAKGSTTVGTADDGEVIARVGEKQTPKTPSEDAGDVEAAVRAAKLEVVRQFVPGFEWDLTANWNRRAKVAVEKYGNNLPVINAILSIETPAVRRGILERLYKE
jgi:hypothetical protein